jgi:hypothetical protein
MRRWVNHRLIEHNALSSPSSCAGGPGAASHNHALLLPTLTIYLSRDNQEIRTSKRSVEAHQELAAAGPLTRRHKHLTTMGLQPCPGKELTDWNANGFGDFHNCHDAGILGAALDGTHIRPVDLASMRQLFLRDTLGLPD